MYLKSKQLKDGEDRLSFGIASPLDSVIPSLNAPYLSKPGAGDLAREFLFLPLMFNGTKHNINSCNHFVMLIAIIQIILGRELNRRLVVSVHRRSGTMQCSNKTSGAKCP